MPNMLVLRGALEWARVVSTACLTAMHTQAVTCRLVQRRPATPALHRVAYSQRGPSGESDEV